MFNSRSDAKTSAKKTYNKTGELSKKTTFGHWKTRKFAIANGVLTYGSPENPNNKVKKIVLSECVLQNADSLTNRPFSFGLFNPKLKHPILLLAKDDDDYKEWYDAIEHYANPELKKLNIVSTLEDINDPLIISDDKGIITSINRAALEMFGYSKFECMGQNVSILMPQTYRDLHREFMSRYLSTGEHRVMGRSRRVTAMRKDATTFPVQLSLGEISTNEGIRFVATMRPIIEVESDQQTQVLFEDYKKFLEEKMSQLRDTMEFEFISMKDRILELESDRTKFKDKSNQLKAQLTVQSEWRNIAESMLSPDQLREIQDALIEYHQNFETPRISTILPSSKPNQKAFDFLSFNQKDSLYNFLPEHVTINKDAVLVFSSEDHLIDSVMSFYDRVNPEKVMDPKPTLLLIKTTKDMIFGAYLSHAWRKSNQYFGNGDCFLFQLHPHCCKFGWKSTQPPYFMMGTEEELLVGGGNGYGLRFNLEIGWSQHCDTFDNEPLTGHPKEPFSVSILHVYNFEAKKKRGV